MTTVPRILIVDDDPMAIQVLFGILAAMGDIRYATSGAEALELLAGQSFDLVLLDAQMPVMDGYATCALVHREHPAVPVIFVTADADPASEIRALETGALDFISKPLNPPVVRARVRTHLQLKQQSDLLRNLINVDALTGIANRRAFDEQSAIEWRRAVRSHAPLSLLMMDIDYFKPYNDHYGHPEGDNCLRRVAETIDACVSRASDLAARYGGEEFAALLPGSAVPQALALGEKIRAAVAALAIPHAYSAASDRVTVSIGVAGGVTRFPPELADSGMRTVDELINRADDALYAAKAAGRNRVALEPDGQGDDGTGCCGPLNDPAAAS